MLALPSLNYYSAKRGFTPEESYNELYSFIRDIVLLTGSDITVNEIYADRKILNPINCKMHTHIVKRAEFKTYEITVSCKGNTYYPGIMGQTVNITISACASVVTYSDNNRYEMYPLTPFVYSNFRYLNDSAIKHINATEFERPLITRLYTESQIDEYLDPDYHPSLAYAVSTETGKITCLFYRKIMYNHPSFDTTDKRFSIGLFDYIGNKPYARNREQEIFEGPFAEHNAHSFSKKFKA